MILLPVFGLLVGVVLSRVRQALLVTAVAAAIGFTVVALTTEEISGPADLFVWGDTAISLLAAWVGVRLRQRINRSRTA